MIITRVWEKRKSRRVQHFMSIIMAFSPGRHASSIVRELASVALRNPLLLGNSLLSPCSGVLGDIQ